MNLFLGYPGEHHMVTCEGCHKNIFLRDAKHHSGSHWCMDCHRKGKHQFTGVGFGPMRFDAQ